MEKSLTSFQLASMIDHTNLKNTATRKDIEQLCNEAKKYKFASVCVNPIHVEFAATLLKDSDVKVCTVVGFPLGASSYESKCFETEVAIKHGADEIDMVIDIGAVLENRFEDVKKDICGVVNSAKDKIVKVILEVCCLTDEQIEKSCKIAMDSGAAFVKTSTGFSTSGATTHSVALMRKTVGNKIGVKAAGGIKCTADALAMIAAGANRLGCSAGVKIMAEYT